MLEGVFLFEVLLFDLLFGGFQEGLRGLELMRLVYFLLGAMFGFRLMKKGGFEAEI